MSKKIKITFWQTTWHHLRRSPWQSFAATLIMFLNFFAATVLVFLLFSFASLLKYFETRPEVTAFLTDSATVPQVQELQQRLSSLEGVREVRYVSKEDALKIYKEQSKDNPLLLEMVNANMLPVSLEISAQNPSFLAVIAETLKSETSMVKEIVFPKDVVERLLVWIKVLKNGILTAIGVLSFISWVVIIVIIGMKINSHRQEVGILKSLGATHSYIRTPFLIEGIIYGLSGSILGFICTLVIGFFLKTQIQSIETFFLPTSILPDLKFIVLVFAGDILGGLSLGFFASYLAAGHYLKKS